MRIATQLREGARAVAEGLARLANVSHVTLGEKRVSGVRTDQVALIVYVARKQDPDEAQRIPTSVEIALSDGSYVTIPTDVVELPSRPRVLGMRAGHLVRAKDGDFGTCGFCFRHGNRNYVITNAHVVANMAQGTFPGEPSVQKPETLELKQIGKTVYISNFAPNVPTDEDLAIIRATNVPSDPMGISAESNPIAKVSNFAATPAQQYWYKINGGKVFCVAPEPSVTDIQLDVDGDWFIYRNFWHLQVTSGVAVGGHSGALICSGSGANIVAHGLLFGGAEPNYVLAFPIDDVLNRAVARLNAL